MTQQYLHPPPVGYKIAEDGEPTLPYKKYFTNLNGTINGFLRKVTYTSALTFTPNQGTTAVFPPYTTDEINSIQNPADGSIVYDTTTNKFKFREGGVWVEK